VWGNVSGSSVPMEDTKAKYNENIDAQNYRNQIIDKIGGE
jgi:hypothetical protein